MDKNATRHTIPHTGHNAPYKHVLSTVFSGPPTMRVPLLPPLAPPPSSLPPPALPRRLQARAVASTLQTYDEAAEGGFEGESSDDEWQRNKKGRRKIKQNKTANFSSFRNKSYGVPAKAKGGGKGQGAAAGGIAEGGSDGEDA